MQHTKLKQLINTRYVIVFLLVVEMNQGENRCSILILIVMKV